MTAKSKRFHEDLKKSQGFAPKAAILMRISTVKTANITSSRNKNRGWYFPKNSAYVCRPAKMEAKMMVKRMNVWNALESAILLNTFRMGSS